MLVEHPRAVLFEMLNQVRPHVGMDDFAEGLRPVEGVERRDAKWAHKQ